MTERQVIKQEKEKRLKWAITQIDKGDGFSELATFVADDLN